MRRLNLLLLLVFSMLFISCRNATVTNFRPNITVDQNQEEKAKKIALLEKNIKSVKKGHTTFYYSTKDTFTNFQGYTFYLSPYIVEEGGISRRVSVRLFAKSVSNRDNVFNRITIYDNRENKVVIDFEKMEREYADDGFLIIESGDTLISKEQMLIMEQFIDSKEIYVTFEKDRKYTYVLNPTVRESFLNILRKYKLILEPAR